MKTIEVTSTLEAFRAVYDAGGHWWNMRTKPGDGRVSSGEVSAAVGYLGVDSEAMAALELHLARLPYHDRSVAEAMLDEGIRVRRQRAPYAIVPPADVEKQPDGSFVVVAGPLAELPGSANPGGTAPLWAGMPPHINPGDTPLDLACRLALLDGKALVAWPLKDPVPEPGPWALAGVVRELIPASSRRGPRTKYVFALAAAPWDA